MSTIDPTALAVNHHILVVAVADHPSRTGSAVTIILLVAFVLLVWAVRQLQPALGIIAELVRLAVRAALASALIIGVLLLLIFATVLH
jgi:hypothetical protein